MQAKARFVALEFVRWTAVYALYLIGRQVAIGNEAAAVRHTEDIVRAERTGAKAAQGQPLDDVSLIGFSSLETLESYPGALNGLLVTAFRGRELPSEQQWGGDHHLAHAHPSGSAGSLYGL